MAETTTTAFPAGQLTPFVVPDNVFVIRTVLTGGQAIQGSVSGAGTTALGGRASCLLPVTPGETLQVAVGLAGPSSPNTGAPTPNGDVLGRGGSGPRAGGASSHIKRGTTRLAVAGGAGSAGTPGTQGGNFGGHGGGAIGGTGVGFGGPGKGGGADPSYATSDGEAATDGSSGSGGGGLIGGRAGYGRSDIAYGPGGGGSGRVPAGGTLETGVSAGNGSAAITVGIAPYAPPVTSPAAGSSVPTGTAVTVSAVFTGASSRDTLSARQVRIDGTFLYDGGSDGAPLPTTALSAGVHTLEVRDANQHGTWGPWSAAQSVTVAPAPPAPTITTPPPGSTVATTPSPVQWTGSATSYRVRRLSDDGGLLGTVVYFDTGVLAGSPGTLLLDFPVSGRSEWLQVAVIDAAGLQSSWASTRVFVQRARPATPAAAAVAVATTENAQPDAIDVAITNPTESGRPAVDHCDVYAGPLGALAKINPSPVPPNSTFRWRLPPSGPDHQVLVVAVAASGATSADFATGSPLGGYGNAPYGTFPYGS